MDSDQDKLTIEDLDWAFCSDDIFEQGEISPDAYKILRIYDSKAVWARGFIGDLLYRVNVENNTAEYMYTLTEAQKDHLMALMPEV